MVVGGADFGIVGGKIFNCLMKVYYIAAFSIIGLSYSLYQVLI
jgi:hypothetical protein